MERKIKKRLFICTVIIGIWVVFVLGRSLYWFYNIENGMNVSLIVSNQHPYTPSKVKIYIDGKMCFSNDKLQVLYAFTDSNLSIGRHVLKAEIDNEIFQNTFWVFLVKWIYVEVQPDNKASKKWVYIETSSSPIGLM